MEADTAQRYRSRILREMNANRANPFNSPPSSTGSHGTVSPTVSSVFSDPDGESTRRLHDDIARVTAPRKLPVNWDAAHRKWPDFFSKPKSHDAPLAILDDDAADKLLLDSRSKENKPPAAALRFADDSTHDVWPGSTKTRAEMQPRVDNESDHSDPVSKSPAHSMAHRLTPKGARSPASMAKAAHGTASHQPQRPSSISDALDRLRRASLSPPPDSRQSRDSASPHLSSAKSSLTAVPSSPDSFADASSCHARSFLMPDISHLGDFVTGTLKFSGSMKNGVPIFVKNGRVHDRRERPTAGAHAEVDGIQVPEVEDKIFVSMDMIRNEIISLQEHHDKVQEYAENLQHKVERLEAQLKSSKGSSDNASQLKPDQQLVARKHHLEMEITSLRSQLEQARRKASESEIENVSLSHERDRAVKRLQSACDDISKLTRKLNVKEKELESSHKQLEVTDQMRHENDTLRRDLMSIRQGRDALERENASLRAENEMLRKELKQLREENGSLRIENSGLRRGDDSLAGENRSLRSTNKSLTEEREELRESLDGAQHELDAAREQVDTLRRQVETVSREKRTLQEDNESLVRHNDKYFNENKLLRRENSGFERSVEDFREENLKLRDDIDFLKQQLDHCRPLPKEDFSARLDEETEENMTSAFFVPDITINTNDSSPAEAAEAREMPPLPEVTSQSHKTTVSRNDTRQTTRDVTRRQAQQASKSKSSKNASIKHAVQQAQKVAFSIPNKATPSSKPVANKGSKRRNPSNGASGHALDILHDVDDTTEPQSVDDTTQDRGTASLNLSARITTHGQTRTRDVTGQSVKSHQTQQTSTRTTQKVAVETDLTNQSSKPTTDASPACPALSTDARRILDGLCQHNCRNCIVCTRITSHRGVVTSAEAASGKKRVTVSRPVPVTDREAADENATVRPSQSPGHALALVIKGLEDEGQHLQLELSRLQARYNSSDKALGRRERLSVAEGIRTLLKRLEVKNDQIYSLYDVLEGQKEAGQAMTEEEVEMTVLNITGMTVRDVTSGSEHFTWEGIPDEA